jgi:hypothetical protein
MADLTKLIQHLRDDADFNRSLTDGRRNQGQCSDGYRARRIEVAEDREGWAHAVEALESALAERDAAICIHRGNEEELKAEVERLRKLIPKDASSWLTEKLGDAEFAKIYTEECARMQGAEDVLAAARAEAVRGFAEWLDRRMLDVKGCYDPVIHYRREDGCVIEVSMGHAATRYLREIAETAGTPDADVGTP